MNHYKTKVVICVLLILSIFISCGFSFATYDNEPDNLINDRDWVVSDAADEWIEITNALQFEQIRTNPSGKYLLANDIDLSGRYPWVPIGTDAVPFSGILNGDGHKITGLKLDIDSMSDGYSDYSFGLFGNLSGEVTNVTIVGKASYGALSSDIRIGMIAGTLTGSLTHCDVEGEINSHNAGDIGGLVGYSAGGTIKFSNYNGAVDVYGRGIVNCGGLCGHGQSMTIENCNNYASVKGASTVGNVNAGGFLGYDEGGSKLGYSVNFGDISITTGQLCACGGLVGTVLSGGHVYNCNNRGDVGSSGEETMAGGIVAFLQNARVSDCVNYALSISGLSAGRIIATTGTGQSLFYNTSVENTLVNGIIPTSRRQPDGINGMDITAESESILNLPNTYWTTGTPAQIVDIVIAHPLYNCGLGSYTGFFIWDYGKYKNTYRVLLFADNFTLGINQGSMSESGVIRLLEIDKSTLLVTDLGEMTNYSESMTWTKCFFTGINSTLKEGDRTLYTTSPNANSEYRTISIRGNNYIYKTYALENLISSTASNVYNPKLANILMALAYAAYEEEGDETEQERTEAIVKAYEDLGFSISKDDLHHYDVDPNSDDYPKDTVAYSIGKKKVGNDNIVLITIRGSAGVFLHSNDWKSNFAFTNLGMGLHEGFNKAATEVYEEIQSYIRNNISEENSLKFIITGHSRGAAVGNLVTYKLINAGFSKQSIYNYNFACPDSARDIPINWNPNGKYDCIFNISNVKDPVGVIPGAYFSSASMTIDNGWFWGKYGTTYFYSRDWGNLGEQIIDMRGWASDFSHRPEVYLNDIKNEWQVSRFKSWEEARLTTIGEFSPVVYIVGKMVGIWCPVDFEIIDKETGQVVGSVIDRKVTYYTGSEDIYIYADGDEKAIYIGNDNDYSIRFTGTADGEMTYTVMDVYSTESTVPGKTFENVALTAGRSFLSEVGGSIEPDAVTLLLTDDKDNPQKEILPSGEEIPYTDGNGETDDDSGNKTLNVPALTGWIGDEGSVANWKEVANATGYQVETRISTKSGKTLTEIVNTTSTSCDLKKIIDSLQTRIENSDEINNSKYRVRAKGDGEIYSEWSGWSEGTGYTGKKIYILGAPVNLKWEGVNKTTASWDTVEGADKYYVSFEIKQGDTISSPSTGVYTTNTSIDLEEDINERLDSISDTSMITAICFKVQAISADDSITKSSEWSEFSADSGYRGGEVTEPEKQEEEIPEDTGDVLSSDIPADGQIPDGIWIAGIKDMVYTGKNITQDYRIYDGKTMLIPKTDYTVAYKNNKKAYTIADPDDLTAKDKKKAPRMLLTMKGNYSGKETVYFSIKPDGEKTDNAGTQVYSVNGDKIRITDVSGNTVLSAVYNKNGAKAPIKVMYEDTVLKEGRDYTLKYSGNTKYPAKKASVTVTGKGKYNGSKTIPITVTRRPFSKDSGIIAVATDKAVGKKAGQFKTTVKVFDSEGRLLKAGTDYEKKIVYLKDGAELTNTDFPGVGDTITVRITGKGGYTDDSIEASYKIVASGQVNDIGKATIRIKGQKYNKGTPVVIDSQDQIFQAYIGRNKTRLSLSTDDGATGDYMVLPGSYSKNINKGIAKVTFVGINGTSGTKTVSYKIDARSLADIWFGWIKPQKYYQTPEEVIKLLKKYCADNIPDDGVDREEMVEDYFSYQLVRSSDLGNGLYAYEGSVMVYRTFAAEVLVLPNGTIYDYEKNLDMFDKYNGYFSYDITHPYTSWDDAVKDPAYIHGGYGDEGTSEDPDDERQEIMSNWKGVYRLDESNFIEVLNVYEDGIIKFRFTVADASGESTVTNTYTAQFTNEAWTEFSIPYQSGINEVFRLADTGIQVSLDIDMRGANDGLYLRTTDK